MNKELSLQLENAANEILNILKEIEPDVKNFVLGFVTKDEKYGTVSNPINADRLCNIGNLLVGLAMEQSIKKLKEDSLC